MRRDEATLLDISEAARRILQFKEGLSLESFLADVKTQSAMTHQFMIIGEAAKRLTPEFTSHHPAIPWQAMARMRDKLIHQYEAVDPYEVWKAAEKDIPELLSFLGPLLPAEDQG
jgi:uncharacterized protein with HEPN domain